jgi:hypothetical protein
MAVTARTWVEGEIATAAKFNTIRDDLLTLDAVAGIKSIQYGSVTLNGGTLTNNATITSVVTTKTVLHHLGQTVESGSALADGLARITLASATSVTATRASSNNVCVVGFCAEEYK